MKGKRYTTEDKIRILREADRGQKKKLSDQGGAWRGPGKQKAAEVQRTFDRRDRELRARSRPRLVLPCCLGLMKTLGFRTNWPGPRHALTSETGFCVLIAVDWTSMLIANNFRPSIWAEAGFRYTNRSYINSRAV